MIGRKRRTLAVFRVRVVGEHRDRFVTAPSITHVALWTRHWPGVRVQRISAPWLV